MTSTLAWVVVALGLLIPVVPRRSIAVAIVTAQALLLAAKALESASTSGDDLASATLATRAVVLAALFTFLLFRTREAPRVQAPVAPLGRAAAAVTLALTLIWLVPHLGLASRDIERATLALVAFGATTVALRRAILFQVVGIVLVENGLALAALDLPGGSALIEVGVAFDLAIIAVVAGVFHHLIFAEFGAGDSASLRSLRDDA